MSPRSATLLLGLLVATPALWGGWVSGTIPPEVAAQRAAVVVVVALVCGHLLQALLRSYLTEHPPQGEPSGPGTPASGVPARRSTDPADTTANDFRKGQP